MGRDNPVELCDHQSHKTEYIEMSDGQHKVLVCSDCNLILEDQGVPEPSNVAE